MKLIEAILSAFGIALVAVVRQPARLFLSILARLIETDKPIFTTVFGTIGATVMLVSSVLNLVAVAWEFPTATDYSSILKTIAVSACTGGLVDFVVGKKGQARARDWLETFYFEASDRLDNLPKLTDSLVRLRPNRVSSDTLRGILFGKKPSTRSKVYRISLVARVGRNCLWNRLTQAFVLVLMTGVFANFNGGASFLVCLFSILAAFLLIDSGLIWWRMSLMEYGHSALEVKEIGRLVAMARRRRDDGGDPGRFIKVYPDEPPSIVVDDWAPEGLGGIRR